MSLREKIAELLRNETQHGTQPPNINALAIAIEAIASTHYESPARLAFDAYQTAAMKTARYPRPNIGSALGYAALGLAGEAGEVANEVKKVIRDDSGEVTLGRREKIIGELGDCLWYAASLASEINETLGSVAARNLYKLAGRAERDTIKGGGEDR